MPYSISFLSPGSFTVSDGLPGDGLFEIRNQDGTLIDSFANPGDAISIFAGVAGVSLTVNITEPLGATSFRIGDLANPASSPDSITIHRIQTTGQVTLVSNGPIVEGGNDAGADIVAGSLVLSANSGVGTAGNAIETQTAVLEAETTTGGINLANMGTVQIGGLTTDVGGLSVTNTGDIRLVAQGSILLSDSEAFEIIRGGSSASNITLIANGFESDIIANADSDAITASGGNISVTAGRDVTLGTIGANFDNDIRARGSVTINAGRDFVIDGFADISSDDFGAATGGDLTIATGRNIHVAASAGEDASIFAGGTAGADMVLTTGVGGRLQLDSPLSYALSATSGNIVVNADRALIAATSGIMANAGEVVLRTATAGREINLGSGTDGALALELSDAEIDRITTANLVLGGDSSGTITVSAGISRAGQNLTLRSGEDILLAANLSSTTTLTLRAGNNLLHQTGSIASGGLFAFVDTVGADDGTGGLGNLGAVSGAVSLDGNAEADTLRGAEGRSQTVHGHDGNDLIVSSGEGSYFGDDGDDTIRGGLSSGLVDELLDGGNGADTLDTSNFGGTYVVNLATGVTNFAFETFVNFENIITGGGGDQITGSAVANTIRTGGGIDTLFGGNGNDVLDGGTDADTMNGGSGDDVFFVDNAGDVAQEANGGGSDTVNSSVTFSLAGQFVEVLNLTGGGAINGTGNGLANRIVGNGSANTLFGNDGNDRLDGGAGADTMNGGLGNDTFVVDNAGDVLQENNGEGTDTVETSISYSLVGQFIELLVLTGAGSINGTGNSLTNTLIGNAGNNVLNGMGGGDSLRGGAGNDTLIVDNAGDTILELDGQGFDTVQSSVTFSLAGQFAEELQLTGSAAINGSGNGLANNLLGNSGINTLNGAGGNDVIAGGLGNDTLIGGAGLDNFWFDTAPGASNFDTISDFVVADDTINLDRTIFTGIAANGVLAAGAFRLGTAAVDADDRILYDSATGNIRYDADGAGGAAAILFAKVTAGLALTNADFVGQP